MPRSGMLSKGAYLSTRFRFDLPSGIEAPIYNSLGYGDCPRSVHRTVGAIHIPRAE